MAQGRAPLVLASATLARLSMAFQYNAIAAMGPLLVTEFELSLGQLGLLIALFTLPAIVLALPSGLLSRRYGDINAGVAALILLTIGGFGGILASEFLTLAATRLVAGFGAILVTIVSGTMLSRRFAGAELGHAMSVSMFAWPMGLGLALAIIPLAAESYGIGAAFAVMGISSAVPLGLYLILAVRRPAPSLARTVDDQANRIPGPAEIGFVCIAAILWLCFNGAFILLLSYGPVHIQGGQVSALEAGLILSLALVANGLATLFAGRFFELGIRPSTLLAACSVGLAIGLAALVVYGAGPAVLIWIGVFSAVPVPPIMALIVSAVADERRNPAMGIFYMLFYALLSGLVPAAGWLGDMTGSTAAPIWAGVVLCTFTLALLPGFLALRGRISG